MLADNKADAAVVITLILAVLAWTIFDRWTTSQERKCECPQVETTP